MRRLAAALALPVLAAACSPFRVPEPPPAPPSALAQRSIARAVLAADIDSMLAVIERVHPNPYTVVSRDSLRRSRDAIVARFPDSTSRFAVWPSYARLVAMIGDGHTNVSAPGEEIIRFISRGGLMLPTRTAAADFGSVTVTAYRSSDSLLRRGDQIFAVNDHPVDSLLRVFAGEIGGESERWRENVAASQFESLLLLNGLRAPYALDVRESAAGAPRRVEVRGASRDSLVASDRRSAASALSGARTFTYRLLSDRTAYMNLVSLAGDRDRFRAALDSVFRQMSADSARALVIDLRYNGGGDSWLGDELLSHLTTTPYRFSSAKLWKMSAEYRAYLKTMVRQPLNHLPVEKVVPTGRRMFSGPAGTIVRFDFESESHSPREPRFGGPVCVLIGAGTFSSAVDLVDGIKTYRLATLIGEETGGRPNSFGEIYYFRTLATGFLVTVSSAAFVRANGDTTDHRGVLTDIEVRRSSEDVRAGRDPVIERARDCPSRAP
jgi:Peptidase family S41